MLVHCTVLRVIFWVYTLHTITFLDLQPILLLTFGYFAIVLYPVYTVFKMQTQGFSMYYCHRTSKSNSCLFIHCSRRKLNPYRAMLSQKNQILTEQCSLYSHRKINPIVLMKIKILAKQYVRCCSHRRSSPHIIMYSLLFLLEVVVVFFKSRLCADFL